MAPDYGYWYNNGALYPDMASCMIAVDRAHAGNGCLQVLRGRTNWAHRTGQYGTQTGAHPERVALRAAFGAGLLRNESGYGSIFTNLLHCSDVNESADPRWSLICCYNTP